MPCSVALRKIRWISFLGVATSAGSKCHDRQEAGCWNLNIPMERASIRKKAGESVFKGVLYFFYNNIRIYNTDCLIEMHFPFQAYFKLQEDRKREYLIAMRKYKDLKGITE